MADEERIGVVFVNLKALPKYKEELLSVIVAGIDGTFNIVSR